MMKAAFFLLALMSAAQDAPSEASETWEGEYLGANGRRGKLTLKLQRKGTDLSGTFELALQNEDEPVRVAGKLEGDAVRLAVLASQGKKFEIQARIVSADPYAKQAVYGIVPDGTLAEGVFIAWRFEK